jgi:nucleotide-binding universal stress UspA family protein
MTTEDSVPNILAPIRPDHDIEWATRFLIKLHERERVRVHLLSVQPSYYGHVRLFFSAAQIRKFHEEDCERELAPVRRALDVAGVPYNVHVRVGSAAEVIAQFAREYHCPQIVMGPARKVGIAELILGTLTREVEHLMQAHGRSCEIV